MSRIEKLIEELCPDGVEYKVLGEVLDYTQPTKYIVESTKYDNSFSTPVLTAGQTFILGYTDETEGIYQATKDCPVIIFDDFTTSFHWVDFDFKVKSSAMKILTPKKDAEVDFRFIFHAMKCIRYNPKDHARQWISVYSQFQIPIPPLPVQQEIVTILDTFTALDASLQAELEARRKQYEHYRNQLLNFEGKEVEWKTLGEISDVTKLAGFEFTAHIKYADKGSIIALRGLNVKNGSLDLSNVKYIDNSNFSKLTRSKLLINDMLFTYVGTVGDVALIDTNNKFYLAPNVSRIRFMTDKVIPRLIMHYFQTFSFKEKQINKYLAYSSLKNLTMENIRKFQIPIPPLSEQERIVGILDKFDALVNTELPPEIAARRKQYEYYREKLLTFEPK